MALKAAVQGASENIHKKNRAMRKNWDFLLIFAFRITTQTMKLYTGKRTYSLLVALPDNAGASVFGTIDFKTILPF